MQADQASKQSVWRFYRDLLHLRKTRPALTTGSFRAISQPGDSYCAYERREGAERLLPGVGTRLLWTGSPYPL